MRAGSRVRATAAACQLHLEIQICDHFGRIQLEAPGFQQLFKIRAAIGNRSEHLVLFLGIDDKR